MSSWLFQELYAARAVRATRGALPLSTGAMWDLALAADILDRASRAVGAHHDSNLRLASSSSSGRRA